MNKLLVTTIAAAMAVLFCAGAQGKPIVIGAATDTEILDGFGTVRGLRLATEEINAAGGVKVGNEMRPFKLEVMDTRDCDPGVPVSEALLVVEKVILDRGADFIIGPSRSEAALASLSLVSRYKKVYLSTCGALSPKFHNTIAENYDKFKYAFRITGESGLHGAGTRRCAERLEGKIRTEPDVHHRPGCGLRQGRRGHSLREAEG